MIGAALRAATGRAWFAFIQSNRIRCISAFHPT